MKKSRYLFAISIVLLLVACSQIEVEQHYSTSQRDHLTKSNAIQNEYAVSIDDIKSLMGQQISATSITSYPSSNDPLLYVVKLDPGFFIISGDKRANPLVAYSARGSIAPETSLEQYILNEFSEPIYTIRNSSSITNEMKQNLSNWEIITSFESKATLSSPLDCKNAINGQRFITHIGPLLETEWGQSDKNPYDHYWNEYCPWVSSSLTGPKSPVGCVAVAAGQFAYYMRDRDSVAVRIPTWASCMGYIDNYVQSFSPILSISKIDEMPLNYSSTSPGEIENARIFLAYIGNLINSDYGTNSTGAFASDLPALFDMWGIDSDYVQFSDSLAIDQLTTYTPVITRGARTGGYAHCWVIDGYDEDLVIPWPFSPNMLEETGSSSFDGSDNNSKTILELQISKQYHMNWGWNGNYDGWYSIDNWTVTGRDYSINKGMIKVH